MFAVFFVASCANNASKELVLGTATTFPPFTFVDNKNGDEIIGFDIELAKIIAKDQGKDLKIKVIPFQELISAVDNGDIDMAISFIAITDERRQVVDFSNAYFYDATIPLIKKSDRNKFANINSKEALGTNLKMAVMSKTLQEGYTVEMAGNNEVLITDTFDIAVEELLNATVDAVILPTLLARGYIDHNSDLMVLPGIEVAITMGGVALKKGNRRLRDDINKTLKRLLDSGEYDKMIQEHVY